MPLVLLDRDGVINHDSANYIRTARQWRALPGSLESIAALNSAGFTVAVCTNQSAVGRGYIDQATLSEIHARMIEALEALGGRLDGIYVCPHAPGAQCACRKPQPGLLHAAMRELGFPPGQTTMVGDSLRDMQAGFAAACSVVLVRTGHGADDESAARALGVEAVFDDLRGAAAALIRPC